MKYKKKRYQSIYALCLGVRIQPTPAHLRAVRGHYFRDMNCQLSPAQCMMGPPACNVVYEL